MKSLCLAMFLALSVATFASADAPWITITGTVVSNSDGVMVLRTDKGDLRFDLDKTTEGPTNVPVNSRITVWYDSDDKPEDKMDARRIELSPLAPAPTQAATPPPAPAPVVTHETVTTERTTTAYNDDELPQTAGPLPLVGGIGAISLACGALLRKLSRRS